MTDLQPDIGFLPLRVNSKTADGKNRYDRTGKRKLIEACQQPELALKAGVNANQLRKWISLERTKTRPGRRARRPAPAIVPIVEVVDAAPVCVPPTPSLPDAQLSATRRGASRYDPRTDRRCLHDS
jgi:transposase